jgi:hypothetical protein
MAKAEEGVLGLAPITQIPTPASGSLLPFATEQPPSREEKRVFEQLALERVVIDATAEKTLLGMDKIADLHEHGAVVFDETVAAILTLKQQTRDREHQQYVDEFTKHQIQLFAQHEMGAIQVGSTNIARVIDRPMYPAPEERGFFQRLFGAR